MENETKKNSLLKRHPFKTGGLLLLVLFLLLEFTMRIAFAVKGYEVGTLVPSWHGFVEVDSLIEQKQFYTDESGLYKAYPPYWEDYGYYINQEGFRGREFVAEAKDSGEMKLLHIGDSFTWGSHAKPIDSCFVDLLDDNSRFISYNAGIPGTDPVQYLRIAEKYVPNLKPDFVLVYFYLANDLMNEYREIKPNIDLHYQTNAGWLPAFYKGRNFKSPGEAYRFIESQYVIKGSFKKLITKTATGTFFLSLPLRIEEYTTWKRKKKGDIPNHYLKKIKKVADQNNTRLLIFVIPSSYADLTEEFDEDRKAYVLNNYPRLFIGLEENTFIFPMKDEHYYEMPDGHFNNDGHKTAANFINEIIQSEIK